MLDMSCQQAFYKVVFVALLLAGGGERIRWGGWSSTHLRWSVRHGKGKSRKQETSSQENDQEKEVTTAS
jgi:hypothetical protein